uniref:Uncharacterized protein n=1 Tax=Rhizophora mucronata TaxID=61149 RepID=A0A2P2QZA3_RHIMU
MFQLTQTQKAIKCSNREIHNSLKVLLPHFLINKQKVKAQNFKTKKE